MQRIVKAALFGAVLAFGGAAPAISATLSNGLDAWYPFNGNANDETGNGNDGSVSNATLTADRNGAPGAAYAFNGVDSTIDIGAGLKPALPHTINLWFNAASTGNMPLFRNDLVDGGSFRHGSFLSVGGNRQAFIQHLSGFSQPATRYGVGTPEEVFEFNEWTMVTAITGIPGQARLFINGVEQIVTATSGTGNAFTYANANGAIGQVPPTPNNGVAFTRTSFDGLIDDVGVWNRALTEQEIQMLFDGVDPLGSTGPAPVPLPASLPALLTGAMILVGLRRRSARGT